MHYAAIKKQKSGSEWILPQAFAGKGAMDNKKPRLFRAGAYDEKIQRRP